MASIVRTEQGAVLALDPHEAQNMASRIARALETGRGTACASVLASAAAAPVAAVRARAAAPRRALAQRSAAARAGRARRGARLTMHSKAISQPDRRDALAAGPRRPRPRRPSCCPRGWSPASRLARAGSAAAKSKSRRRRVPRVSENRPIVDEPTRRDRRAPARRDVRAAQPGRPMVASLASIADRPRSRRSAAVGRRPAMPAAASRVTRRSARSFATAAGRRSCAAADSRPPWTRRSRASKSSSALRAPARRRRSPRLRRRSARARGRRLGLVAADGFRVGAVEQLRLYADIIGARSRSRGRRGDRAVAGRAAAARARRHRRPLAGRRRARLDSCGALSALPRRAHASGAAAGRRPARGATPRSPTASARGRRRWS